MVPLDRRTLRPSSHPPLIRPHDVHHRQTAPQNRLGSRRRRRTRRLRVRAPAASAAAAEPLPPDLPRLFKTVRLQSGRHPALGRLARAPACLCLCLCLF